MEDTGDGWIGYDRCFRMTAAGNPSVNWATIMALGILWKGKKFTMQALF